MKPVTILNDSEYFQEITHRIAQTKAGDRVALMTMSFDPTEQRISDVMQQLYAAAERGVHTQLNIDAYCFLITNKVLPTSALLFDFRPEKLANPDFKVRYQALEKLRDCGGVTGITNVPTRRLANPFGGRSHIKFTVINDSVYIGGCNLGHSIQIDLMVRADDQGTSNWVYDFMQNSKQASNIDTMLHGTDEAHAIDETTKLLIDAGRPGQSLIFDEALQLIDQAKQWIFITCQYFPGNATAQHLLAAHQRGVSVTIFFGNNAHHKGLRWPHEFAELRDRTKYPKMFFNHRIDKRSIRLHAKVLATEQGAMVGSHNYVTQGVRFGTAESTLYRRGPDFALQIVDAFKKRVAIAEQDAGLR